jgi:hypothetical protein
MIHTIESPEFPGRFNFELINERNLPRIDLRGNE